MTQTPNDRSPLKRYAWLSIAAALVTMGLKGGAYFLTGSVGLLSDALESLVNLAGAIMVLSMLSVAARPADDNHTYGHSKAEYFSSGFEGSLILIAAASIIYTAVKRLIDPQPLEQLGIGLLVLFLASMVNLGVSLILKRAGKRHNAV
ncbi:MAG: cation diffusion facilitator family transporter, partial [Anaerolineaceae bacterium]|nr:cation diffusion facilitator family transporter [Anaerolineaceae bacterium]